MIRTDANMEQNENRPLLQPAASGSGSASSPSTTHPHPYSHSQPRSTYGGIGIQRNGVLTTATDGGREVGQRGGRGTRLGLRTVRAVSGQVVRSSLDIVHSYSRSQQLYFGSHLPSAAPPSFVEDLHFADTYDDDNDNHHGESPYDYRGRDEERNIRGRGRGRARDPSGTDSDSSSSSPSPSPSPGPGPGSAGNDLRRKTRRRRSREDSRISNLSGVVSLNSLNSTSADVTGEDEGDKAEEEEKKRGGAKTEWKGKKSLSSSKSKQKSKSKYLGGRAGEDDSLILLDDHEEEDEGPEKVEEITQSSAVFKTDIFQSSTGPGQHQRGGRKGVGNDSGAPAVSPLDVHAESESPFGHHGLAHPQSRRRSTITSSHSNDARSHWYGAGIGYGSTPSNAKFVMDSVRNFTPMSGGTKSRRESKLPAIEGEYSANNDEEGSGAGGGGASKMDVEKDHQDIDKTPTNTSRLDLPTPRSTHQDLAPFSPSSPMSLPSRAENDTSYSRAQYNRNRRFHRPSNLSLQSRASTTTNGGGGGSLAPPSFLSPFSQISAFNGNGNGNDNDDPAFSSTPDLRHRRSGPAPSIADTWMERSSIATRPMSVRSLGGMEMGNSTTGQTLFNAIAVLVGIGVLAEPLAFAYTGWIMGSILLVTFGFITNYTAKLLAKIMLQDPNLHGYSDLGIKAFGWKARLWVDVLFCCELFALSIAWIVLFGDSLEAVLGYLPSNTYKIIGFFIIAPTTLLPLHLLSIPSLLSFFSSVLLILILVIDGLTKKDAPGSIIDPAITNLAPEWQNGNFLGGIGLLLAGFGGHAILPSLARDMREPHKYNKTINTAYLVAGFLFAVCGAAGYLMFGHNVTSEVTRDLMMPEYGFSKTLNQVATWLIIINPVTKFALCTRPLNLTLETILNLGPTAPSRDEMIPKASPTQLDEIEELFEGSDKEEDLHSTWEESPSQIGLSTTGAFPPPLPPAAHVTSDYVQVEKRKTVFRIVARIAVSLACVIVAIILPGFEKLMAFLGSFTTFMICIILPLIFYTALTPPEERSRSRDVFHAIVLVISTITMIAGTGYAIVTE